MESVHLAARSARNIALVRRRKAKLPRRPVKLEILPADVSMDLERTCSRGPKKGRTLDFGRLTDDGGAACRAAATQHVDLVCHRKAPAPHAAGGEKTTEDGAMYLMGACRSGSLVHARVFEDLHFAA